MENFDIKYIPINGNIVPNEDFFVILNEEGELQRVFANNFLLNKEKEYDVVACYGPSGTGGITINPTLSKGYYIQIGNKIIFRGQAVLDASPTSGWHIIVPTGNYSRKYSNRSVSVMMGQSVNDTAPVSSGEVSYTNYDRFIVGSATGCCAWFSGYYFID